MAALSYCRLWSWPLQSGCARECIPEQGDLRRSEGEHGKQHAEEADDGEGKLWGFAMAILLEGPPLE